jgi:hypothetical protein
MTLILVVRPCGVVMLWQFAENRCGKTVGRRVPTMAGGRLPHVINLIPRRW